MQEINGGSLDLCRKNSVGGSKPNDLKGEILGNPLINCKTDPPVYFLVPYLATPQKKEVFAKVFDFYFLKIII